jgi:predicted dehydrogenase
MDSEAFECNHEPSRRTFLKVAASACAAATIIPSNAFGANDRLTFGVVGVGGQGTGHVNRLMERVDADNIRVAAVADVYQRRVTRAKDICKGDGYLDYRKMLERNDIDAILIATSDHWHAKIAIDALEAGKHVYVEKPMTHTIPQALKLRDAVRKTGKVLQVGPQATGDDCYWKAHEAIQAGRIGKPTWAQASYNRNARVCLFNEHQKIDPTAGPDKTGEDFIDWNFWLGYKWDLAPKIPWTPDHFFRFRKYWPYSGGVATDLLYHKLAPLLIALAGSNGAYPKRVNASGGLYIEKDGRDIPDTFLMTVDYPDEYSVFLVSTLTNDMPVPDRVYGKYGTMDLGGSVKLNPNGEFAKDFQEKNNGEGKASIETAERRDIVGNFIDVVRGKEKTLYCNAELGAATMVAIKMAVDSYRFSKTLQWDAKKEKVIGA